MSFWLKIDESLKIKIKCLKELSMSYCCPTQGQFKTCFGIFITLFSWDRIFLKKVWASTIYIEITKNYCLPSQTGLRLAPSMPALTYFSFSFSKSLWLHYFIHSPLAPLYFLHAWLALIFLKEIQSASFL